MGSERLQKSKILKELLKEQDSGGRIYGAVCSSLSVLHRHGLLKVSRFVQRIIPIKEKFWTEIKRQIYHYFTVLHSYLHQLVVL